MQQSCHRHKKKKNLGYKAGHAAAAVPSQGRVPAISEGAVRTSDEGNLAKNVGMKVKPTA